MKEWARTEQRPAAREGRSNAEPSSFNPTTYQIGARHRLSQIDTAFSAMGDGPIQRYHEPQESEREQLFWVRLPSGLFQLKLVGVAVGGGGIFQYESGTVVAGPFDIFTEKPTSLFGSDELEGMDYSFDPDKEFVPNVEGEGRASDVYGGTVTPLSATSPESVFKESLEGYDQPALHRGLYTRGDLAHRQRGARMTQNQIRSALSLVVRTPFGGLRVITREIPQTYSSGGSTKRDTKTLIAWLIKCGVISSKKEFSAELHAHSEQWFVMDERDNMATIVQQLAAGMQHGETIVGVMLDVASVPNTVCNGCHGSLDGLMHFYILPAVEKIAGGPVQAIVNATGAQKFRGGGEHEADTAEWAESVVDYEGIAKNEAADRQREQRELRGKSRGRAESPKSEAPESKAPSLSLEELRTLARRYGNVAVVNGDGLACYIRAILTFLAYRGVILPGQIENLVNALTDHLQHVQLRIGARMIDAGGLAAAEVRRAIAQLTGHVMHGGVDVGITVYQFDAERGGFVDFIANEGTYQVNLLYTPGHFDAFFPF